MASFLDGKINLGNPSGPRAAKRRVRSGAPTAPNTTGSLSSRGASPAGGQRKRDRQRGGQLSAEDMLMLFKSMPVPNRGYRNPNASQPAKMGQGMAWFDENNSPEKVAGRQAQADAGRQKLLNQGTANGASAVDFMKQTKGFTDASGAFVPPTMPMTPTSAYGSGSVTMLPPGQKARGTMTDPLTGRKTFMDEYLPQQSQVQDTKYGSMMEQEDGGTLANRMPKSTGSNSQTDMTTLFPGNSAPLPSTPAPNSASAGNDFWAWDKANRGQDTIGDVSPGEVPQEPAVPQMYDFIPPGGSLPTVGTLGQKELARRSSRGVVPGFFDNVESGAQSMQDGLTSFLRKLFGNPTPPQVPQYRQPM